MLHCLAIRLCREQKEGSRWCSSQGITEIFYPKYSKDNPCQIWNIGFFKSLGIQLFLKDEVDKGLTNFISSHFNFLCDEEKCPTEVL